MTFVSLFAGVGGFDAGLELAGMSSLLQVERDAKCRDVLARHFPAVAQMADVRELLALLELRNARKTSRRFVRPDLLCGGFPCQDVSLAGRRAGLTGTRSGLWWTFRRIIGIWRPRWILIENVPGLLSSNGGRDMGAVLSGLAQLGYRYAYRVLDSQWFGVPQRRRRVFIVGCFGDVRSASQVLFEPTCLPWDSPPRREAWKELAATLTAGAATGRGVNRPGRRREDDYNLVAHSVMCHYAKGGDPTTDNYVVVSNRGNYSDAAFDGVRRLTPRECERLQGFPDDWTKAGASGEHMSDAARYRMMGNAITVPVAEWIGRQINASIAAAHLTSTPAMPMQEAIDSE